METKEAASLEDMFFCNKCATGGGMTDEEEEDVEDPVEEEEEDDEEEDEKEDDNDDDDDDELKREGDRKRLHKEVFAFFVRGFMCMCECLAA